MQRPFNFFGYELTNSFKCTAKDMMNIAKAYRLEVESKINNDSFIRSYINVNNGINSELSKIVLAIDIGGTTLKIGLLVISPDGSETFLKTPLKITLPKREEKYNVFMWTAMHIRDYLPKMYYGKAYAVLSFSYPMEIIEKSKAKILDVTKLGNVSEIQIYSDPVELMNNALKEYKIGVKVALILNDSTATFLASYKTDPSTFLGIILGTGTNGAFILDSGEIIVSEWGSFQSKSIKQTSFDKKIAKSAKERNTYTGFTECMIGGCNFLELANHVLEKRKYQKLESLQDILSHKENSSEEHQIIMMIKSRNLSILAGMICGVALAKKVTGYAVVSCNGSILEDPECYKILKAEVEECKSQFEELRRTYFDFKFINEGTLVGSAMGVYYI
ncbi:Hexokinase-1 [Astathelohania contejeani]|uniref:Phosphotransferase n=1 Tax=Astathelohania contejeani TaxID=164912 RepID=A0ABQ7HZQ4_9MICR|nr:Hexokinase-1 [Thelohania contejeani]